MTIGIIGTVIGLGVLGAGLYYLVKEKHDSESKRIYSIVSAVGAAVIVLSVLKLVLWS